MMIKSFIGILMLLAIVITGCAGPTLRVSDVAPVPQHDTVRLPIEYKLKTGDEIIIKIYAHPELNETQIIRPDGRISLQLIDEIMAAGQTPNNLANQITNKLKKYIRNSKTTVIVKQSRQAKVYLGGEIKHAGMIDFSAQQTVLQAIFQVGGFLNTARLTDVIVVRRGKENRAYAFKVDLENPTNDIVLAPDDIVYVPRSSVASANLFVEQYIDRILPFTPSVGINYELNRQIYQP